ncbi:MAG: galactokinase [Verrucomicrobia bacterium]|nr:galactokinase [Verrucomicrobiota bacterium]MCF7709229.1 galactokinase [Verrucomicrobiota bacterium]
MSKSELERITTESAEQFSRLFGGEPEWFVAAPGRVNLIGEHVDYNDGFVLPMAIEQSVVIAAGPAENESATFHSVAADESIKIDLAAQLRPAAPAWSNYIRGVIAGFNHAADEVPGLNAVIHGNIPLGGGLSSSAALELATCHTLETAAGHELNQLDRIRRCQKAEHDFAGVPCGIMDQFIVERAVKEHALLLDCKSLEARDVAFNDSDVIILITNSGVAHELGKGEYAVRREQCVNAARILGVDSLRQAEINMLDHNKLPTAEFKRARHVITEIQRTLDFAATIENKDWQEAGRLMYKSHYSLRDDYEVSCAELDLLVDIAESLGEENGVFGSRMTGGGFGGCTVTLVKAESREKVINAIKEEYKKNTHITPMVFASRPSQGARKLKPEASYLAIRTP